MTTDKATLQYREHQISKVRTDHSNEVFGSKTIQITANGGEIKTFVLAIDAGEFNAIESILLRKYKCTPLDKMEPYELFMTLQGWDTETLIGELKHIDRNGEYDDDVTREYAINTIFKFLILDNQ